MSINYTYKDKTNKDKLRAVYNLLEQMRLEHNRVGEIALSNLKENQGKWATYTKLFFEKQAPLLVEQRRLREAIRKESYSDKEWFVLKKTVSLLESLWGSKETSKVITTNAKADELDQLKAIDFSKLEGDFVDPLQDWTTYTETDTGGVLTVTANTITVTNLNRGEGCSVVKDFTANHFSTVWTNPHLISTKETAHGNESDLDIYGITNSASPVDMIDPSIQVAWAESSGGYIELGHISSGESISEVDFTNIGLNTQIWLTINRTGAGTVMAIYSDSSRETLVDTQSVSQGATSFRYMCHAYTRDGSNTNNTSGYIYDLDLQEAAPPEGWTNIAKVNNIASSTIAKVNGIAVASVGKFNGVAV